MAFLPKTRQGNSALILTIVSFILFVVGSVLPSKTGYTGIEIIIHNPIQAIMTMMIFAAGIGAGALGLISVIKHKDRSFLIFIVILFGVYNVLSFFGVIFNVFFS